MTDEAEGSQNIQADNNSIAFGGISVGGNVGDIRIGHTIGFTSEQVSTLITQISTTFQPKPFDGRSPYKGLDVFEEEDSELFFGREKLVDDLVSRVRDSCTVFITGPSGSGKSSLVRAGLIHALKQGKIPGSERWQYATIKPGRDPFEAMAGAFSRLKSPELGDYFLQNVSRAEVLHKCAESTLSERSDQRLVLFIDQFEEIFTQIHKDKAQTFVDLLAHAADVENGRVILLFAMRSDFIPNCVIYPKLNALLNRQFVQIGAMQGDELVSAIAQPALRVGLRIDPDLIAQIINDMHGEPGALPLMQFALKDLFDSQQAKGGLIALTLRDYLERGGIRKALERHADKSFSKLNGHERKLTRAIFSSLIEIGRGTVDTRRTAIFDELVPASARNEEVEVIVRKLADARLLTTDEVAGKDTVTISHEKLIDAWPWLKKLVDENRDVIAAQNEIAKDAKEWDDHGRDPSYLYSGARLGVAQEQLVTNKIVLSGLSKDFIEEGIALREAERKARESLRRRVIGGLTAGIVIALVLAGFAGYQMLQAQEQSKIALARQLAAQAQSINVTRNSIQRTAMLLAIQSMKMNPSAEAAHMLIDNNLAAPTIWVMPHDEPVFGVDFSPDGRYLVAGGADHTARVWEIATGREVAHIADDNIVWFVSFSPDGKYILSANWYETLRVWEAATGREIARMTHGEEVKSLTFSPNGHYVLSGGCDELNERYECSSGTARVWEATTGREIARMSNYRDVYSTDFSPDGKFVVSGGCDEVDDLDNCILGTARVWESITGSEVARMTYPTAVGSVAFSPDGQYVVSGGDDGTVHVWESMTGTQVARMQHEYWVNTVAFSPDGSYVVSGSADKTARVWEAATGMEIVRMTHDNQVYSSTFSQDGKYVVSAGADGTARLWEATTGRELARMTHDDTVEDVVFSPDGRHIVSASQDGMVRLWRGVSVNELARITHDSGISEAAFSKDGKYVVSGSYDGTARVWEVATGMEIARMTHDDVVENIAFSPDDKYVVSGSYDGTARVWEVATGMEIARMTHDSQVYSVAFSQNGKYVVSGSWDKTARVWEAMTGKEIARMTHDQGAALAYGVSYAGISPDGKYVVSGGGVYDNESRIWELATGKQIALMSQPFSVTAAVFSRDGKFILTAGCAITEGRVYVTECTEGAVRVSDAATGKLIASMAHAGEVNSIAFSPDGKYVLSGSADGTARVWDVGTGKEIARMTHDDEVWSVGFSPDSRYAVSGSSDTTARIWEVKTGKEVARITHKDSISTVAFSSDGRHVVSGSDDGVVRAWAWQANDLIASACMNLPRNLTREEWKHYISDVLPYQAVCENLPIEREVTPTPIETP